MLSLLFVLATADVQLQCVAPEAKSVSFASDLFGWGLQKPMTNSDGVWTYTLDLPDDARFEYKFIVDGEWVNDPKAKMIDNTVGGFNSVYEGPKYRFSLNDAPPKAPMQRQSFQVNGREVIVYTPENPKGKPVLVYGDGQNYEKYGKVHNVLQNLVEAGKARTAVLVLVPPVDRMREYGMEWREYGEFILDEVLPEVRKRTGASEKAEDVFIGGSSMGGLISLRLAEEFPDKVAGGVHSQSGAFVNYSGGDFRSVITPESFKKLAPTTRLWLCWGTYEGELTASNIDAAKTLDSMGRPYAKSITNEGHNWTAWRNRMEEALIYLLPPQ